MDNSRRDFIKASAMASVATVAAGGATATASESNESAADTGVQWTKSVCRFCGTGCGVMIGHKDDRIVAMRGDPKHPTTKGLVCAKSLFLPKIVHSKDRLTTPMVRKDGEFVPISWDDAMELMADKFAKAIKKHGPDSVAYYGSGQAMTEESYLCNRLFKGGIGTNNVEGNPRLCMASAVGGYVTTFGKDEPMGCYEDIWHANTIFLVGSNTAECHPVIFDQILAAKQANRRLNIIMLDPRKNPIASICRVHLAPKPGLDLAVFHAMAHCLIRDGNHDEAFIEKNCQFKVMKDGKAVRVGFEGYVKFLEDFSPERAELISGVPAEKIEEAAKLFSYGPTMSIWTMGLNQRTRGVWANNLMHNLHLITGNIGKPGATPFSMTGQPNACGGVRDTGTLCHLLPYGRSVKKEADRKEMEKLWGSKPGTIPSKPGLHTVALFQALGQDKIKAMIMLTTNPGQSMPNLHPVRDAIGKPRKDKPFIVVLDTFPTRTTELADLVLPAAMWSEKTGVFGMSERRYQIHPQIKSPPGDARSDFDIMLDFAGRLEDKGVVKKGYIKGKFKNTDDVWEEVCLASKGTPYDFMGITRERLHRERGVRWPCPTEDHPGTARRFVKGDDPNLDSGKYADYTLAQGETKFFSAPDDRAIVWLRPAIGPAEPTDAEYPYSLSTGRVLEHWHTGTMTMRADELKRSYPHCFVEINPIDARKLGVRSGDMMKLTSRRGQAKIRARIVDMPQPGTVFVPMHWEDKESLINFVCNDAFDAGSKQPEYKICAIKLEKA